MKHWIFNGLLISGLSILTACGADKTETEKKEFKKLSNEEALDAEMFAIDGNAAKHDRVANSLSFSNEYGEAVEVLAHLTPKNEILKLEEKFSKGEGKDNGVITYYLKDGIQFATREYYEDFSDTNAVKFVDRVSYYDTLGKVLATKEKRVNYEEEVEGVKYVSATPKACSINRAMNVLEQTGAFEITFRGFALTEVINYLIVGKPGKDGFTSTLRIENEDSFIKQASLNPDGFLNKKCRVSFENKEMSGFKYQLYLGGEWL